MGPGAASLANDALAFEWSAAFIRYPYEVGLIAPRADIFLAEFENNGVVAYVNSVPDQKAWLFWLGGGNDCIRRGVMVNITSVVMRSVLNELSKLPMNGKSPIHGIVTLVLRSSSWMRPPSTIVSPSRIFKVVSADRFPKRNC